MRRTPTDASSTRRRVRRAANLLLVGALMLSGCSMFGPPQIDPTRVLQTVEFSLDSDGKIVDANGTAILVNESTGETRSESTTYEPVDVVADLPVRVTTGYRTDERSGADLGDLQGYTGSIEIDIALENLTVAPEAVAYDAVGSSRTSPALVGVPLSIAASTALPGVSPSQVVFDADAERRTNGVVSSDRSNGTLVQWGAVLAPPQTEATATLRLVADVEELDVPSIHVSVLSGLHTDLSLAGALGSVLDSGPGSALGAQQQAIRLVSDVNDVLTRAGATITEVRENLNDTSDRLGARAAQRLHDSSTSLTAEMQALSAQLTALQNGLSSSASSTSSAMNSEIVQTVNSLSSMLGDTRESPRALLTEGAGCGAPVSALEPAATVYSTFLTLSGLLEGYADASEACQSRILAKLDRALGPVAADSELCAAELAASATCALFHSRETVGASLDDLAASGREIAGGIQADALEEAERVLHDELRTQVSGLRARVAQLLEDQRSLDTWTALYREIEAAQAASADLAELSAQLHDASDVLRSAAAEQTSIARDICRIEAADGDAGTVDALSIRLTGIDCAGAEADPTALPADMHIIDLSKQAEALNATAGMLNPNGSDAPLARLHTHLASLQAELDALRAFTGEHSVSQAVADDLLQYAEGADTAADDLLAQLELAESEQSTLRERISEEFARASSAAEQQIARDLDAQTSALEEHRESAKNDLEASYQELIAGLRTSAQETAVDGKTLVESQTTALAAREQQATQTLSERTAAALASIERSTSAATRDITAASAQLTDSLNNVLLDLGDPKVQGSGILGAMATSAAQTDTADYQLAEASQHASGYANVRDQDISGILLRGAQFRASLDKTASLPPFHFDVPDGATSQTLYTFTVAGKGR